jgi:hypothetical protein
MKKNDRYFYTKDTGAVLIVAEGATLGNAFYTHMAIWPLPFTVVGHLVDVSSKFNLTASGKVHDLQK